MTYRRGLVLGAAGALTVAIGYTLWASSAPHWVDQLSATAAFVIFPWLYSSKRFA